MAAFSGKFVPALIAAVFMAIAASSASAADIWEKDVDAAWAKSQQSGKPLVLFITTDGCFFCDKMAKETCKNATVMKDLTDGFIPVMVHAKTNAEFVRRIGVQAFPTTVIINKDAKVVAALPGFLSVPQLRESLRVARVASAEPVVNRR